MQPPSGHGTSTRLLSLLGSGTSIELVTYSDGSFGINQDGQVLGNWPASDEHVCINVFYKLGELQSARTCIVMSREAFRTALEQFSERAKLN